MADMIMEGLTNLSPRRMQSLLEAASSIKVKRLFFVFAERHNHATGASTQRQYHHCQFLKPLMWFRWVVPYDYL